MYQLKRNLLSTTVLPAVVAAGAVLAVGFVAVPCGRGPGNRIYSAAAENPEAIPAPVAMRGMNAGCCAAACDACNPCAATCEACNPCAAACSPCNPCAVECNACNPCAAGCGAYLPEAVSGMNAGCCAAACEACDPCAAACSPCNPCAVCNPCNPCAASCGACGASLEVEPTLEEAMAAYVGAAQPSQSGAMSFLSRAFRIS